MTLIAISPIDSVCPAGQVEAREHIKGGATAEVKTTESGSLPLHVSPTLGNGPCTWAMLYIGERARTVHERCCTRVSVARTVHERCCTRVSVARTVHQRRCPHL